MVGVRFEAFLRACVLAIRSISEFFAVLAMVAALCSRDPVHLGARRHDAGLRSRSGPSLSRWHGARGGVASNERARRSRVQSPGHGAVLGAGIRLERARAFRKALSAPEIKAACVSLAGTSSICTPTLRSSPSSSLVDWRPSISQRRLRMIASTCASTCGCPAIHARASATSRSARFRSAIAHLQYIVAMSESSSGS